jgi:hypothetical protein
VQRYLVAVSPHLDIDTHVAHRRRLPRRGNTVAVLTAAPVSHQYRRARFAPSCAVRDAHPGAPDEPAFGAADGFSPLLTRWKV